MQEHAASGEVSPSIVDRLGAPVCLLAPDLTVLGASARWLSWTGVDAEQLTGRHILDLLPDTRELGPSPWERARRGETVVIPRHRGQIAGRELWWEGRLSPFVMSGGTGVLVEARGAGELEEPCPDLGDGTARPPGAEGVADSAPADAQLASVAAAVPGVLYRCELKPDGAICCPFSSPLAEELFGLERAVVVDDLAPFYARVHADDLPPLQESIAESARELSRWHGLFRYRHPTKGERWIEAWSVPQGQAHRVVWYGYATDVTDRMRAETALRESEQHYRRFFRNLLEMVGVHEAVRTPGGEIVDWVVRDVNEPGSAILGRRRDDVIGRRFGEMLPPDTVGALTARWPAVLATQQAVQYEFELRGRVIWISVARMDAETVSAVADDITERKRAEERLRESDQRKGEFLAILSHELRNPLAPIRNAIHLLAQADPRTDQASRAQAVIRRQTEHLARLVDDLLDVTRVSRGKVELHRKRVDLRDVVQRTCDDLRTLFDARGIALRTELPSQPVWVDADPTRLVQVVGNVLNNAVKFSREGGSVALTLSAGKGEAALRVRDQGVGIPPELLGRLFEPFVQAEKGLARTLGGLGLGLALVKGLVHLHGGSVTAHSQGADRGTEIDITLPLATAPRGPANEAASQPVQPADILVIDDNVDAASTLAEVLEVEGHHVTIATDGRTGLERARQIRPGIILCDIGLPDVDGYEIARQLRRDAAFRRTRLVAVSGYALPEDRRRALDAGFDAHVAKPASLDVLLASLGGA